MPWVVSGLSAPETWTELSYLVSRPLDRSGRRNTYARLAGRNQAWHWAAMCVRKYDMQEPGPGALCWEYMVGRSALRQKYFFLVHQSLHTESYPTTTLFITRREVQCERFIFIEILERSRPLHTPRLQQNRPSKQHPSHGAIHICNDDSIQRCVHLFEPVPSWCTLNRAGKHGTVNHDDAMNTAHQNMKIQ